MEHNHTPEAPKSIPKTAQEPLLPRTVRPFRPRQFIFGLALSAGGLTLMLIVAAGALHDAGAEGAVSLPATGLCMVLGLMMLGGGFGQMATAVPPLDSPEFQEIFSQKMKPAAGEEIPQTARKDCSENDAEVASEGTDEEEKKEQTRDTFVSTVVSDVMASHG